MFCRSLFLAALVLTAVGQAHAAAPEDCAKIAADAERLACYDLQFKASVSPVPQAPESKWVVQEQVSKIDDSKNVFLRLTSSEPITDRLGQPSDLVLWIACRERKTSLWIHFGGQFMADLNGGGEVTYRIDKAAAKTRSFEESNSNEALGLWNGIPAIAFIRELFGGTMLLIHATPFNENSVTAELPIAGLEEAIKPLREACRW
ncbi:type VI secretion system-associated protein TagO [Inquilinus sp. NPDC058860]|uniref:type VI secretion system-associated protein TagO n=1 Tax=Inquilinus sp. NPDC058860 TaxID=3346652 RepID=UPI0036929307